MHYLRGQDICICHFGKLTKWDGKLILRDASINKLRSDYSLSRYLLYSFPLTINRKVIPNSMIVPIRLLPKGWFEHPLLKALASPMLNYNICCNTIRIYNSGYVRYSALSLWSLSLYCILKATMSGWNVYLLELNQHFLLFWQCSILFPKNIG